MSLPAYPLAAPASRSHLAYLNGIRALAALYVVLFHICLQFGGVSYGMRGLLLNAFRGGHFAVDVFIVLSGFCLALPIARHGTLQGGARTFYKKRARRILPPMLASLGVAVVCSVLGAQFGVHRPPEVTVRALLTNVLMLQDLFPAQNFLDGVLWSVAVEWKIYFLFPLFVLLWRRKGLWAIWTTGIVLSMIAYVLLRSVFPGLPLRYVCPWFIGLFALGMCAALMPASKRQEKPARWGWVSIALAFVLLILHHLAPGDDDGISSSRSLLWAVDTAAGMTTASLLLWLRAEQTWAACACARALSWRPLVWLGTFAFSLYLVHYPLLNVIAGALLSGTALSPNASGLAVAVVELLVIITVAYGFFLLCERPFLNTRRAETPAETVRDAAISPAP